MIIVSEIVHWPYALFRAQGEPAFLKSPVTRVGGRTLGGYELTARTDLGFWRHTMPNVLIRTRSLAQKEAWNAISTALGGRAGLVVMSAYHVSSRLQKLAKQLKSEQTFSDGTTFSDGAGFTGEPPLVEMAEDAQIGATVVKLRALKDDIQLSGVKFSHRYALHETGPVLEQYGNVVRVPVYPAMRRKISAGALLIISEPSCLMHPASDNEMDVQFGLGVYTHKTLNFVEALDFWNEQAKS